MLLMRWRLVLLWLLLTVHLESLLACWPLRCKCCFGRHNLSWQYWVCEAKPHLNKTQRFSFPAWLVKWAGRVGGRGIGSKVIWHAHGGFLFICKCPLSLADVLPLCNCAKGNLSIQSCQSVSCLPLLSTPSPCAVSLFRLPCWCMSGFSHHWLTATANISALNGFISCVKMPFVILFLLRGKKPCYIQYRLNWWSVYCKY